MKVFVGVTAIAGSLLLASACESSETLKPQTANAEELTALLKRCRDDRAAVGEETCRAAQEEFRKRFFKPPIANEKRG